MDTATLTAPDIALAILDGKFDGDLDALSNAIRERRKVADNLKGLFLRAGDRVQFNDKVRPKYLQGVKATVVRVNKTRAVIKLDDPTGRYGTGNTTAPYAIIDKVEDAD